MLTVSNLSVRYGHGSMILKNINAEFPCSKITSIIGPNGSGKSTLVKSIYGFVEVNSGEIEYEGEIVTDVNPVEMLREYNFSYIPQERTIFPELTVKENLELGGWTIRNANSLLNDSFNKVFAKFPDLENKRNVRAKMMSGGQQRMLEIARCLMIDPSVILIDEPSAGLAPALASEVYETIDNLRSQDVSILLVDQNIERAVRYSDIITVIEGGKISEQKKSINFDLSKYTSRGNIFD